MANEQQETQETENPLEPLDTLESLEGQDLAQIEAQYHGVYARAKESGTFGDYAQAANHYEEASSIARAFGEEDERLMDSLARLAYCQYRLGAARQAEDVYREVLNLMERFHKSRHPDRFASVLWALAVLLSDDKRYSEAEALFRQSMTVTENWAGPMDRFVADCLWGLSKCLTNTGKFEEATQCIKRAIHIYEALPAGENAEEFLTTNYSNLGALLMQRGNLKEAVPMLKKAIEMRISLAGDFDSILMNLCSKLALALIQEKNYKDSQKYLKQALKIAQGLHGEESDEAARKMIGLANCLSLLDKPEPAVKLLKKARKVLTKANALEIDGTLLSACLYELNNCHQKLGLTKEMTEGLEALYALYQSNNFLPKGALYADSLLKLATVNTDACRYKKARGYLEEALVVREKLFGKEHKLVADVLMRLGNCLAKMNLSGEASEVLRRAEQMLVDLKKRA